MRRTLSTGAVLAALLFSTLLAPGTPAEARPTDGANDQFHYGYSVPATSKCSKNVCVHWVATSADAATPEFAAATLKAWQRAYKVMTRKLNFRKPRSDGKLGGGKGKLDVYLKELGGAGQFGFCQAEKVKKRFFAQTYCLTDNDFVNPIYGGLPVGSLIQTTAAKSMFSAIQAAYDTEEDSWFADATGTWAEERVFPGANLNRRFLDGSQIMAPGVPLDTWIAGAPHQYGNWIWFEFLAKKFKPTIVADFWKRAAADQQDEWSMKAIGKVLKKKRSGGLTAAYAEFAAVNTSPARFYRDGASWPQPAITTVALSSAAPTYALPATPLPHLTSTSVRLLPDPGLRKNSTSLKVKFKGPRAKKSPGGFLLVAMKSGKVKRIFVEFNKRGKAKVKVPFTSRKVASVTVTVVNASIRYRCFRSTGYSCEGTPKDDGSVFTWKAKALRK